MPIAKVNGCEIFYETDGKRPDVVFIHGEDHGIEMFADQVAAFRDNHRCMTYDRRGHGKSEFTPYGYSLRNQMLDLAGLLDHLEIERPVLVAVAMATTIAASYALEYPGRARGLGAGVLVRARRLPADGKAAGEKIHHDLRRAAHADVRNPARRAASRVSSSTSTARATRSCRYCPRSPWCATRAVRMMTGHAPEHYVKAAEFYTSMPNLAPRLKEVSCPMLGICGDDDPCPDDPKLLAGAKNFRQIWIPGARRFTMLEAPAGLQFRAVKFSREPALSRSSATRKPDAALTPPPGQVEAPTMNNPSTGVRYRVQPRNGRAR